MQVLRQRARWIWRRREGLPLRPDGGWGTVDYEQDRNLYVYFRRSIDLPAAPAAAPAHVSADGRYQLFVNGQLVGRGPARCDPLWQSFDTYDLAPLLRAGRNVVAALVHTYGRDTSWYQVPRAEWSRAFGCGGFFLQADLRPARGRVLPLDSDDRWRYRVSTAWDVATPGGGVGYAELFDARQAGPWLDPNLDDSDWEQAVVLRRPGLNRGPELRPFPVMVPRDIPPLLDERRAAEAVVSAGETAEADSAANPVDQLAAESPGPLTSCTIEPADRPPTAARPIVVRTAPGRAATLLFDFGRVVSGRPVLDVEGGEGTVIDLAYSERTEGGGVPVQRADAVTSQNADRLILGGGPLRWERFEWAGFRYLQLTVRNAAVPLRLKDVALNFTSYPVQRRGAFECSDRLLDRLWEAGAYTLQLCMHDGYEDCPSREQRQWVGDAYVEMLVNFAAFGDAALAARLLRLVAQSQRADGMTHMATPGDAVRWGIFIADYCLYWVMTLHQYGLYTGDLALETELLPAVERALAWFERHRDGDGLLADVPGWIFIDWADVDRRGRCTALNALYHRTLLAAAQMARRQGLADLGRRWREAARRVRHALNDHLWDPERRLYADCAVDGGRGRRVSQHAQAATIACGVAPRRAWRAMLSAAMDDSRLKMTSSGAGDPAGADFDEEHDIVLAQPFFMHWLHRALSAAGRHGDLLDNIRRRWAPMLDAGSSTIWEHWHGRQSQCHAWSATPTFDLSTEVLGVRPLTPGFGRFAVAPRPAGLEWARGRFPTPAGDIEVAWERPDGRFQLDLWVPRGLTAEPALPPPAGGRWARVTVDGRPARGRLLLAAGRHRLEAAR